MTIIGNLYTNKMKYVKKNTEMTYHICLSFHKNTNIIFKDNNVIKINF